MRLVVTGLGGERGGDLLFRGIDFALGAGESLTVTGPNGAGKSTLLRVIAGLLPAAAGSVRLEGGGEHWPDAMSACHYLGHQNAMKTSLSVAENLGFWRSFLGQPGLSVDAALAAVRLAGIGHLPWGYLSAGQRRRTAIARLLISHRPLWLLDEPTGGLDAASDEMFAALMHAHLAGGGIIIAVTHQPLRLDGAQTLRMGQVAAYA